MPQPTTTGGSLMGYASSVDTGQVVPFALYDGELAATSSSAGVANTAYLVGVTLRVNAVMTAIRVRFAAGGSGHFDLGVYDATGTNNTPNNLLAHAASTAASIATATGTQTPAFIGGNLPLSPGNYWLAFWIDNATDTWNKASANANIPVIQSGTNAGPLPVLASSLSGLANGNLKPLLEGLFLNNWS